MKALKTMCSALLGMAIVSSLVLAADKATYPVTVPVGDPGNTADGSGYGAVAYKYEIGKTEVTTEEFCAFLNGVAKSDPHELYDGRMAGANDDEHGGIIRSGDSGSYTYAVKDGWAKKPVGYVTWETALRYANWLTNGQGAGDTEKGSYTFAGNEASLPDHAALAAGKGVKWVLSTENEWYKAAYYDPKKSGGAGYWLYATKSDAAPSVNLNTGGPSDAGGFEASAYGTHDQNGNQWEWLENRTDNKVGLRGGSWYINDNDSYLQSSARWDVLSAKWPHYGFRVVKLGTAESK